jgi:hypothetical protein
MMTVAILLLIISIMPVLVTVSLHLLLLHEKAAGAASRRCNIRVIFIIFHLALLLLLLHQLRRRCKRGTATQPLAHAQSPLVTDRDKCHNKQVLETTVAATGHARFFSGLGEGRALFHARNFVFSPALPARLGERNEGFYAMNLAGLQSSIVTGTSSTFSRSFSRFFASIWRNC